MTARLRCYRSSCRSNAVSHNTASRHVPRGKLFRARRQIVFMCRLHRQRANQSDEATHCVVSPMELRRLLSTSGVPLPRRASRLARPRAVTCLLPRSCQADCTNCLPGPCWKNTFTENVFISTEKSAVDDDD